MAPALNSLLAYVGHSKSGNHVAGGNSAPCGYGAVLVRGEEVTFFWGYGGVADPNVAAAWAVIAVAHKLLQGGSGQDAEDILIERSLSFSTSKPWTAFSLEVRGAPRGLKLFVNEHFPNWQKEFGVTGLPGHQIDVIKGKNAVETWNELTVLGMFGHLEFESSTHSSPYQTKATKIARHMKSRAESLGLGAADALSDRGFAATIDEVLAL